VSNGSEKAPHSSHWAITRTWASSRLPTSTVYRPA
jgi:hypothetical protein